MSSTIEQATKALINLVSGHVALAERAISAIHSEMENALESSDGLAEIPNVRPRVIQELRTLSHESPLVHGMGFIADPALESSGNAMQWFYRDPTSSSGLTHLVVSTDPRNLSYYDYAESAWYTETLGDDDLHVTSPYVDFSGTNRYVVTVSRRVRRADVHVGICGADIVIGDLQSLLQPLLLKLPKPSALIDQQGAVLATNAAALLSANRTEPKAGEFSRFVPGLPWLVVTPQATSSGGRRPTKGTKALGV